MTIELETLRELVDLARLSASARYEMFLDLALGKPKARVVIEPVGPDGGIKYWRDSEGMHHVPKRRLDEIIVG